MKNILEISNVSKSYDGFKLDNLNLNLPYGCIMGVIGENGAGKSTTIKLILDLIHKDSGSIKIFGKDYKSITKIEKEEIGVVLDGSHLPEKLNLKEIKSVMKNIYRTWDDEIFDTYINKFSLPGKKIIQEYSKGMKMKLSIAIALSHNPTLLILDEATGGLDPVVRDEILDVFWDFVQDENHSVLISSHILSDLEKICDYISFIHKGKLIFCESKEILSEKYGLLKCSEEDLKYLDKQDIISYRRNQFSVEALVIKDKIPKELIIDNATVEDIMLYHVREGV
ncbi:ABC transporter ATP-binding protein [Romboutsia weinsteinii]|uniref:ABC transporter ATP-binding protein n=1 Tax=Romboutsia weinsteinii TaxID=2020949 RepID=A0A255IMY2_9FIRM|nr:ABC transporter ATP-binding protein [Romboutsia weinsteinii]RDY27750.1 ABC transporter ATP-binding protein [Romboutsia weinsteinii]